MIIQVNTNSSIEGSARLEDYVKETLQSKLERFSNEITRIEVHLSDQNGDKPGQDDNQCKIEARLKGMNPITVIEKAGDIDSAITGASNKMRTVLTTQLDKLKN
jgi:ribosome-associated translation inhibitor RaiA